MIRAKKADSNNYQTITVRDANLKKAEDKTLDCSSVSTKFIFHGICSQISGQDMVDNHYFSMQNGEFLSAVNPSLHYVNGLRWYLEIIDRNGENANLAKTGKISIVAIDEDGATGMMPHGALPIMYVHEWKKNVFALDESRVSCQLLSL